MSTASSRFRPRCWPKPYPRRGRASQQHSSRGSLLGAYTPFVDLSGVDPDVKREIKIGGGFLNNLASTADPKAFVYAFDGGAFPNVSLIQPRLNSVEEW